MTADNPRRPAFELRDGKRIRVIWHEGGPAAEPIRLADGEHLQTVLPGVAPVSRAARDVAAHRARREARRDHQPMPAGGLFDDAARLQQELF